jgi:hypothetical protein
MGLDSRSERSPGLTELRCYTLHRHYPFISKPWDGLEFLLLWRVFINRAKTDAWPFFFFCGNVDFF